MLYGTFKILLSPLFFVLSPHTKKHTQTPTQTMDNYRHHPAQCRMMMTRGTGCAWSRATVVAAPCSNLLSCAASGVQGIRTAARIAAIA